MKITFQTIVLIALLLVAISCSRKIASENVISVSSLTGTWEIREAQSGMLPTKQYPAGSGYRYQFTENSYQQFVNGHLQKSGTYRLEEDITVEKEVGLDLPDGEFTTRIIFDEDLTSPKTFLQLQADKLHFISGFFPVDAGSRQIFVKTGDNK